VNEPNDRPSKTHPDRRTMTKTLYAEFTVKPGSEARVAEMMRELTEQVRSEPGNQLFLPYTRESNPREYFVFEVYEDAAAFQESGVTVSDLSWAVPPSAKSAILSAPGLGNTWSVMVFRPFWANTSTEERSR
jgi:quinol monooxygenase YgiN